MKRFFLVAVPFLLLASGLLLNFPALRWLELKSIDWRFGWQGPCPSSGRIAIVAIDEKSLNREGRWPWPRAKMAELIRRIEEAGAAQIELDITFAEPDPDDSLLAAALGLKETAAGGAGGAVGGYFFLQSVDELKSAEIGPAEMERSLQSILPTALPEISTLKKRLLPMAGVVANNPTIAAATATQGYFNAFPDPDGVIRRFPLTVQYQGRIFPSLALETFSRHEGGFSPLPLLDENEDLKGFSVGRRLIPTNRRGEVLIHYRADQRVFPVYSATDFLSDKKPPQAVAGKTVLVGATAVGIYDLRVTPISPNLPGVLIQANLLDNLYVGDFLTENTWTKLVGIGAMFVATVLLGLLLPNINILLGVLFTLAAGGGTWFLAHKLFIQNYVIPLATPLLTIFTVFVSITIHRALTEEKQKRMIRGAFRYYLHPDIVEELIRNPDKLKLGGERTDCTILFSDVRNFTSISEKMLPETLLQMMNDYFEPISQNILEAGGYIDKFIGDAVMAIFGAPKKSADHALAACRAALAMKETVRSLESVFQQKYGIAEFKTGIGIHTGPVTLGNIGSSKRLNYTAMGDAVNLASRLEGATKTLSAAIVVSEKTEALVRGTIETHYLDEITVKGKEEKIRVYEVLSLRSSDKGSAAK